MNPLALANKYADQIVSKGKIDRNIIYRLTGNASKPVDSKHLAHEAIWLIATENPKYPAPVVLKKAKQLYTKWLREDYNEYRTELRRKIAFSDLYPEYAENEAEQRCELESELFYNLDQLVQKLGIHLGLWAIILYVSENDRSKAQSVWRYLGVEPTVPQKLIARRVSDTIKRLV